MRGIVSWNVRALERSARRELQDQAQTGWDSIVAMEGPERLSGRVRRLLLGAEWADREQIRERSMFRLHMEMAAARREQGRGKKSPSKNIRAKEKTILGVFHPKNPHKNHFFFDGDNSFWLGIIFF